MEHGTWKTVVGRRLPNLNTLLSGFARGETMNEERYVVAHGLRGVLGVVVVRGEKGRETQ
jgi:hypothetical protein